MLNQWVTSRSNTKFWCLAIPIAILTFMQNQTEMGKVMTTNRKDKMVKSHSQTLRPGDFTPREKPNRTVLEEDCSQNTDSLTSACTYQLHCYPLPGLIVNEQLGSLWRWVKEHSLLPIARSCKDGWIDFASALLTKIKPCFSLVVWLESRLYLEELGLPSRVERLGMDNFAELGFLKFIWKDELKAKTVNKREL